MTHPPSYMLIDESETVQFARIFDQSACVEAHELELIVIEVDHMVGRYEFDRQVFEWLIDDTCGVDMKFSSVSVSALPTHREFSASFASVIS